MSVEKRTNADGTRSYKVRWREGDRNRARSFRTRRDAELFDADLVRRRRLGTLAALDAGTMTLDAFITDTWAPQRAADLKPATRTFYAGLYRAHIAPTFATVPLREISPQRVAAWQAERVKVGAGRKAIREALSLLGSILGYAVELEHLQANAARAVRPVKRARRDVVQPLAPATVERVRRTLCEPMPIAVPETQRKSGRRAAYVQADTRTPQTRQRDAALVSVLAYGGLRPGEALALTWRDVRDSTLLVEHATDGTGGRKGTKTDHARTVRLLDALASDLREWRLAAGRPIAGALVFPRSDGELWTKVDWDNWRDRTWRKACARAGVEPIPRPYDLRHSFASLLLAEGRAIHYVAEQLGHGAEQTLRTYGHVIADYRDREAIDADAEIRVARGLVCPPRTHDAAGGQAATGA
jgi:integrase